MKPLQRGKLSNLLSFFSWCREEGIMIKNLSSIYVPNQRGSNWIKVKPEYQSDRVCDLDVVVVGASYGKGKRRTGLLSHFLCAVWGEGSADRKFNRCDPHSFWTVKNPPLLTFCRVGNGYTVRMIFCNSL